ESHREGGDCPGAAELLRLRRQRAVRTNGSDAAAGGRVDEVRSLHGSVDARTRRGICDGTHVGHLRTDGGLRAFEWPDAAGEPTAVDSRARESHASPAADPGWVNFLSPGNGANRQRDGTTG